MSSGEAPSPTRFEVLALAGTLLLGLLSLPFPFGGDQAFFAVGALEMDHGKSLYRDFWDIKPPGIFLFFLAAGKLFGFTEIGIHAFELLLMTAFAALLVVALRPHVRRPLLRAAAPLLTVGVYYTVTWAGHLTQVEALVGPWLFLSLWLSTRPFGSEGRKRWAFLVAAGACGGVAVVFKILFLPLVVGFASISIALAAASRPRPLLAALQEAAVFAAGVALPLLAVGLSFAAAGTLPLLLETAFVTPGRIALEMPRGDNARLRTGITWFLVKFGPLLPAALVAAWSTIKRRDNPLRIGLVFWIVAGVGVILIQRQSWWEYHYLLLFVPVGVLATMGLEEILEGAAARPFFARNPGRWALPLVGAILLLPFVKSVGGKTLRIVRHGGLVRSEARRDYRSEIHPAYGVALQHTEFLRAPGALPGDIYVCGDPLFYFVSGREQATSMNGWALEVFLASQWTHLRTELEARRPPYVFVSPFYEDLIAARSPDLARLLDRAYAPRLRTSEGVWYVLK